MLRKSRPRFLLFLAISSCAIIVTLYKLFTALEIYSMPQQQQIHSEADEFVRISSNVTITDIKNILLWTKYYGGAKWWSIYGGGEIMNQTLFKELRCPESRCSLTTDRSYLSDVSKFDALIFHQRDVDFNDLPIHGQRNLNQRWVFAVMESSAYSMIRLSKFNKMFNWTMTHRLDSDFVTPYGTFVQIKPHPPDGTERLTKLISQFGRQNAKLAYRSILDESSKVSKPGESVVEKTSRRPKAAWIVSHCETKSKREYLADEMRKEGLDIHVFGQCGDTKPCHDKNQTQCYHSMENDFKFYLSFENSICKDYLTEKFWSAMQTNMIPIVLSGAFTKRKGKKRKWWSMEDENIKKRKKMITPPPHSYINVDDFATVRELVDHIRKVDSNPVLFAEYMWWKGYYEVRDRLIDQNQGFCELCEKLWSNSSDEPQVYEDMSHWWGRRSECHPWKGASCNVNIVSILLQSFSRNNVCNNRKLFRHNKW